MAATKKKATTKKSSTKKTSTTKSAKKTNKVVESQPVQEHKKTNLKKIYIVIIIVLSILLLISSTIEIINIFTPSENLLPTTEPSQNISQEEKENINKLFSEDTDLSQARKDNNNDEIVGAFSKYILMIILIIPSISAIASKKNLFLLTLIIKPP